MTDIENLVLKINRITILKSQAAGPAIDWLHVQELMHEGCKACAQPVLAPKFPYQKLTACTTLPCTDMKHHPSKVWPKESLGLKPYMIYRRKTDGTDQDDKK